MTSPRSAAFALFEALPLKRLVSESGLGSAETLSDRELEIAFGKLSAAIRRATTVAA